MPPSKVRDADQLPLQAQRYETERHIKNKSTYWLLGRRSAVTWLALT